MSFDKIFDLTAGVYFYFYNILGVVGKTPATKTFFAQKVVDGKYYYELSWKKKVMVYNGDLRCWSSNGDRP